MAISKRAVKITNGIYAAYSSFSGYLFGITPDKRSAVECVVQKVLDIVEAESVELAAPIQEVPA